RLGFRAVTPVFDGATEEEIEAELARAWMIDRAWDEAVEKAWEWLKQQEYDKDSIEDDDEVRRLYLEDWLGERGYDVYELISDVTYARRSVLREWLRDKGFDPDTILSFEDDKRPIDERLESDKQAVKACLHLWLQFEGQDVAEDSTLEELRKQADDYSLESGRPVPILGKQILRDGKTGEPYDQPVTVGVMTMLKLHHLVED